MKVCLYAGVLAVALLGLSVVRGQAPNYPAANPGAPIAASPAGLPSGPRPAAGDAPEPGLNDYLTYLRTAGCCGPLGRDGPINSEVFVRNGVSFPIGGSILGRALDPGYMLQGGARVLFFTPRQDLAWTAELGITTTWYDAGRDIIGVMHNVRRPILIHQSANNNVQATATDGTPLFETVANLPLTTSSVNETYVHLSGGHEIYLLGNADCGDQDPKWRVGYDLGGRWGSAKLVFKETLSHIPLSQPAIDAAIAANPNLQFQTLIPGSFPFKHRTDVVGGLFVALHSDVEVPYKSVILYAGVRAEFSYIWADLLQSQNNTDLMSINVLLNLGCRF